MPHHHISLQPHGEYCPVAVFPFSFKQTENTMNSRTYMLHTDPGHGWLEVPMAELRRLGIAWSISSCSYRYGGIAYLEEDCDAPRFVEALRAQGIEVKFVPRYQEVTPIRRYPHYWCEAMTG